MMIKNRIFPEGNISDRQSSCKYVIIAYSKLGKRNSMYVVCGKSNACSRGEAWKPLKGAAKQLSKIIEIFLNSPKFSINSTSTMLSLV
jgi:hypothetical protein